MNIVIIKGRLTRDPDIRYTQTGTATCRFSVACDRYNKNGEQSADFISCVAFGKTAENISQYFGKGSDIVVRGSIKTGSYEKDGRKVYTTDIWVEGFEFCGSKSQQAATPAQAPQYSSPAPAPAPQYSAPSYEQMGFTAVDPGTVQDDLPF